jgi:hypothetical protein
MGRYRVLSPFTPLLLLLLLLLTLLTLSFRRERLEGHLLYISFRRERHLLHIIWLKNFGGFLLSINKIETSMGPVIAWQNIMLYKILYVSICEAIFSTIEMTTTKGAINISIIHVYQRKLPRYLFTRQEQSELIMLIESNLVIIIRTCGTYSIKRAMKIKVTHFIAKFTQKRIKLTNLFTKLI